MQTRIVRVDCDRCTDERHLDEMLAAPVASLKMDEPVGMPTETVYGLAANCLRAAAATRIFSVKNRPMDNPLIVHISSLDMLHMVVHPAFLADIPSRVQAVMDRFWPGPLTLLLPAHPNLPSEVTAGLSTVGVRFPSHPVALALISRAGFPLAAPSANLSGRPSPTTAQHVLADLQGRIEWIVDGGVSDVGLESTVVDLLHTPPVILRPGGITHAMLSGLIPDLVVYRQKHLRTGDEEVSSMELDESRPSTPGMKYRHYSPSAPVILFSLRHPTDNVVSDSQQLLPHIEAFIRGEGRGRRIVRLVISDASSLAVKFSDEQYEELPLSHTGSLVEIAQNLFGGLRAADDRQPDLIVAEAVAEHDEGLAIMNRLVKAAGEEVRYF